MSIHGIYKSMTPEYTDEQIGMLGAVTKSFVSYKRLLTESIEEAIRLRPNEKIIGLEIQSDGVSVLIQ